MQSSPVEAKKEGGKFRAENEHMKTLQIITYVLTHDKHNQ